MPEKTIRLLHDFLQQSGGQLSTRARGKEFVALTEAEVQLVERLYERTVGSIDVPPPAPRDS